MRKRIIAALFACFFLFSTPLCVFAAVETTSGAANGQSVYIAGNPDLYPIEYYDTEAKAYKGMLPDLYGEISERTGLNFTYIRGGTVNEQNRLAKNRQVEIVSAHRRGEVAALSDEVRLLCFEQNGETIDIWIGFTDIADSTVIASVKEAIGNIPDSELLALALQASAQPRKMVSVRWLLLVILVLLAVIAVLTALVARNRRKIKRSLQDKLTDPLTGIGNDKYFAQNYRSAVTADSYSLYYVIYISLNLQRIEKFIGTAEAEEVERYAANILASFVGEQDFAARIGYGAFLCAYQCPSEEEMGVRATELLNKLNAYKQTFLEECRTLFRAGIYHLNSANIPLETVSMNARQGYLLAHQNKQPYIFVTDALLNKEAAKAKLQRRLSDAIKNGEFKMYMQFIVDAKSGVILGAEAVSRWYHPENGVLLPAQYIEAMYTSGLIEQLDFYIFEQVCRQLDHWSKTDKKHLWISCNFTRETVSHSDFFSRFEETVNRYAFDRNKLIIELAEDSLADNKAVAYQNILACKNSGFKIALDDFGSGYSSFSDLCDYPIDLIKIDRHIVVKSITPRGNALLRGIIKLAHDLGIKVLCEGVETEKENINSINADCDYIQGYYYSHVLPQEETERYFLKYQNAKKQEPSA